MKYDAIILNSKQASDFWTAFWDGIGNWIPVESLVAAKEDPARCPAGCWEGDAGDLEPDEADCYRCPVCGSPVVFEMESILDGQWHDDPR